jgi:hypothetical protein
MVHKFHYHSIYHISNLISTFFYAEYLVTPEEWPTIQYITSSSSSEEVLVDIGLYNATKENLEWQSMLFKQSTVHHTVKFTAEP